jgi:hypothetical protein
LSQERFGALAVLKDTWHCELSLAIREFQFTLATLCARALIPRSIERRDQRELNEFLETCPETLEAYSVDQEWIRIHASCLQREVVRPRRIYQCRCNVFSLLSDFVGRIYIERLYGHGAR